MTDYTAEAETRILVYAPMGKDGQMASQVLASAGIVCCICRELQEMLRELNAGAGALLIVEEALVAGALAPLAQHVAHQPTWSDMPILVLTLHGADSLGLNDVLEKLGNVTLLERPVRTAALISAARSALRARLRQYQVREADQRKDEFLAALAHELRNPLAPIGTSMMVLKRMYPAAFAVTQVREVVERQINHLTRLIDDLLDVARITRGKIALRRERITLASVMAHTVEICSALGESRKHRIDVVQPPQEVLLDADPVRLVQTLSNILANALKYTIKPGTILFAASVEQGSVIFTIRDPGIGLEQASLSHIFDMFTQSTPALPNAQGGLGIGLSLAKRFTEMHGGTIHATSDGPNSGSQFVLTLPVVVQTVGAIPARHIEDENIVAGNRQVLVVDDNRDGADMLQRLFEADGFTVLTAYDGRQAVETAKASQPDIVVMDIGMPGMNGYEAVRLMRQQQGGANILMIALTGWGQDDARKLASEAGFDHHLVKPVDFDVLKSYLDGTHARCA